jgi:hypothetical protein
VDVSLRLWLGVLAACQIAAAPAFAQTGGLGGGLPGGGTHLRGGSGNAATQQAPRTAPTALKVQPEVWPRLDPGAMLCGSEDALKQYQEAMATASPDAPPPLPEGCKRVLEQMPISIVQRDGPSRVMVKATQPPDRTGWTDAWLPEKRP